jgi:phage-related protein (TIGR01555 family)
VTIPCGLPSAVGLLRRLLRYRTDSVSLTTASRSDSMTLLGGSPGGRWVDPAGMGGSLDRAQATEYHPGDPVDQWLADALLECNPLARRIAAKEGEECTREGYDVTSVGPALGDAIEAECDGDGGLGLLGHLADARTWARAYGGGALVLFIDDARQPDQPVDRAAIRRINAVMSADRWELAVQEWGRDPRERRTFGKPRIYQFQLNRGGGGTQSMRVHADRVIRIRGIPLPRRRALIRQGWDGSVFDQCWAALREYGATHLQVAEAVRLLNVGVLTSPALNAAVETSEGTQAFITRLELMREFSGAYGDIGVGQGETYQIANRSLAGLDAAVKAAVDALVAAADGMPRLVLLGEVTAGFSNASDGELRSWYDQCAARQPKIYTPAVRAVIDLILLSHEGPTQGRLVPYEIEWRPLYQMSESERADLDLKRAQRRQADIASTVVSPQQVQAGDPSVVELYGDLQAPPPDPTQEPLEGDEPLVDAPDDQPEQEGVVSLTPAAPSSNPIPADLMTTASAGQAIGVSSQRVRSMMRRGVLEYWDFDGDWRCSAADLAKLGRRHVV